MENKNQPIKVPMRIGSEKYGTMEMKTDEVVLFVESCVENGSPMKEAVADMRMLDALLYSKRLHTVVHGHIKTTSRGHYRKGSTLYDTMVGIIDGRAKGAFDGF